jgi:polysaccharide export outer membrane protein
MSARRAKIAGLLLAAGLATVFPVLRALGQTGDTSISDIGAQVLQGLSSGQRDAIVNQLGVGGSAAQAAGARRLTPEEQLEQQRMRRLTPEQKEELDRLSPFLAPDDWVVVTVDFNPLPAIAAAPNTLQQTGLGATTGVPSSVLAAIQQNPGQAALAGAAVGGLGTGGAASGLPLGAAAPAGPGGTPGTGAVAATTATAGGYAAAAPNAPGLLRGESNAPKPPDLTEEQRMQRDKLIDLIRLKNPYQLSHDGVLTLPGFAPIPLAGLTEQLATLRLGAEPALQQLYMRVTKLPLKKVGQPSLKLFGYDLFDRPISTFAPATNVPVPANYVMGPEDELEVQLYGTTNRFVHLIVGRDGRVQFPDLGPISVGGMTFDAAKSTIENRVARQITGTHANVSMADTRTIRVFVLGDVREPGSYTISGLGTMTSALFAAGGVTKIGSLRTIVLKRQGVLVRRLDMYDMLIRGDTTDDAHLLPGDVIFVPPIGPTISVDGEVRRPAIYETRGEASVESIVQLAGGLTAEADRQKAALTRIDAAQRRIVLQVDLGGSNAQVRDGDALRIPRLRPTLDAGVQVEGHVFSPGSFAYHDGMRLTEVIRSADDLRPNADLHYILIRRELPPDRRIVVLSADLEAALKAPGSEADLVLMPRDRVMAFDLQSSRDRVIQPLLEDLRLQSSSQRPTPVVRIEGRVNVPGEYPLEQGMTVRDLVRAGGSLSDAAYGGQAELTRYTVVNGEARRTELITVDLAAVLRDDPKSNFRLEPFDSLSVKQLQAWDDQEEVTLLGQVKFPGRYSIKHGETLKSVVLRAGGLTDLAFPEGAVFTRKELREREQKQLDTFAARMQSDIAFMALQGAGSTSQAQGGAALAVGQALIEQLRGAKAVGRLVINLKSALGRPMGSTSDVLLRGGDQLLVPKYEQEVTVIGEVQNATSHLYRPGFRRADYIALSGGETRRADDGRIYVVRADGSVVQHESGRWFAGESNPIKPGDTVVVPLNPEHLPTLPLWQAVTQILYNIAIAAAAVHAL